MGSMLNLIFGRTRNININIAILIPCAIDIWFYVRGCLVRAGYFVEALFPGPYLWLPFDTQDGIVNAKTLTDRNGKIYL